MTERLFIHGAVLLDPDSTTPSSLGVLVEDGRIEALLRPGSPPPGDSRIIDLKGRLLAPGFIDLHYHGELIFLEPEAYASASYASSASLVRHGVTAFLPTTVAWSQPDLLPRVKAIAEVVGASSVPGAVPLGLHLEGPWISPAAAGAQPAKAIRPVARNEITEVLARGNGTIRMVTYAPEIPGADELQTELTRHDVVGALGHSLAEPDGVAEAVSRGASHVTHLFNAMGTWHHRAPGLAGATLADDRLTCDLICDGAHVHPTAVRAASRALEDRLVLITDRIEPPAGRAGSTAQLENSPSFGSGSILDDGTAIRFADGSLAGSSVTLDLALRNFRDFAGVSLLNAVKACTLQPARVLGIDAERGTLRRGARADFAILDEAGCVRETWVGGRRIYLA